MLNDERPVGHLYQYMAPNSKYIESKCPHIPTYMWVRTHSPTTHHPPPHDPNPTPTNGDECHYLLKMCYEASMTKTNSPLTSDIIGARSPPPPKVVVSDPPQPTCTITAIWCCHKFLNQWQCNLQMKAVLPLGNQFATALGCINNTGPWQASPTREAIAPVPLSTTNAPIGTMEGNQE